MTYVKFGLMILTSTIVMFGLMYANIFAAEHIFWSETRFWMALLMGAAMAVVMMGFMAGMYPSRAANIGIVAAAALTFALALWLVRSQATVQDESYMRAMIPHHSIAIMTSERAEIPDARVRKLADEIARAQRREIAEMRFLLSRRAEGELAPETFSDPPAVTGSLAEALSAAQRAQLDPVEMSEAVAREALPGRELCGFRFTREAEPAFWSAGDDGAGALTLNGLVIPLEFARVGYWRTKGAAVTIRPLGDSGDWRSDAEMVFTLFSGPEIGYRGFWSCGGE